MVTSRSGRAEGYRSAVEIQALTGVHPVVLANMAKRREITCHLVPQNDRPPIPTYKIAEVQALLSGRIG